MNALTPTVEKNIDQELLHEEERLDKLETADLENKVRTELGIPLPRGKNAKDRSWLIKALIITKEVELFEKHKVPIPTSRFQEHLSFFRSSNLKSSTLAKQEDSEDLLLDGLEAGEQLHQQKKKERRIMSEKHATPEAPAKHKKDAAAEVVKEVKQAKVAAPKTPKAPRAAKEEPVVKAEPAGPRTNVTTGKRIVATDHEFRRKDSNQAKVFAQISDAGAKGLTVDELMERITRNVTTEKKVKEAAWWAFWFFPKKGWAKLVEDHHKR